MRGTTAERGAGQLACRGARETGQQGEHGERGARTHAAKVGPERSAGLDIPASRPVCHRRLIPGRVRLRPLVRMPAQPGLNVRAGRHHAQASIAGVGQRVPHQRVADTLALGRGRDLGVLEVENIISEHGVHQLRVAAGKRHEETGLIGVVLNGQCEPTARRVTIR